MRLANAREGEGFIAISADARKRFWLDRARTAAISAHTNAFKINEDVVIPLDKLAEYSRGIERINIEQSIANKLEVLEAFDAQLEENIPAAGDDDEDVDELERNKYLLARELLGEVRQRWQTLAGCLDRPASEFTDGKGGSVLLADEENCVCRMATACSTCCCAAISGCRTATS